MFLLFSIAITLVLIEVILRQNLDHFFQESNLNLKKIPKLILDREYRFLSPEKINWDHDPVLGWKLLPNKRVEIEIGVPGFTFTHRYSYNTDSECRRVTSENPNKFSNLPNITVLGCSFTYGHSLDEKDTYAWKLQEKFPQYKVNNYGVAGYSLYQSLLVLEQTIKKDKPVAVVFGFHPDLGRRNTNSFNWVHLIQKTWKIPSCVASNNTLKRFAPKGYISLPYEKIRLIKILELYLNKVFFFKRSKKETIRNTMELLLLELKKTCEANGTKLVVACIDNSSEYYKFFFKNKFNWCVTGVDTQEVNANGTYKWILFPFDNHPNVEANVKYAQTIEEALKLVLAEKNCEPDPRQVLTETLKKDRGDYIYPHF